MSTGLSPDLSQRPDASPIAQAPDNHGFMAHTPDPQAYHRMPGGRIMLPRADQHGKSRGFDPEAPGVVIIDPSDPVTGEGGTVVDLAEMARQNAEATDAVMEQPPVVAQPQLPPQVASALQQETTPTHAIFAGAPSDPRDPQPGTMPVTNKSVKLTKGPEAMMAPVPVPSNIPTASAPVIQAHSYDTPPPMPTPEQQLQQPIPQQQLPTSPQLPPQPDPAVQEILGQLAAAQAQTAATLSKMAEEKEREREEAVEAKTEDIELDVKQDARLLEVSEAIRVFSGPARSPSSPVVFDLGAGGIHRVRFHHVAVREPSASIMLFYDDRWDDGHRFLPPVTPEGETIKVTLPEVTDRQYNVSVLQLSNTLGHVDITQLLIHDPEQKPARPSEDEDVDTTGFHIM